MTYTTLKDHAQRAFGLLDGEVPPDQLKTNCHENLTFYTRDTPGVRTHLLQIAQSVNPLHLALDTGEERDRIENNLRKVKTSDEARSATVALIAANLGVMPRCLAEHPSESCSNIFANHARWDSVMMIVASVYCDQYIERHVPKDGFFIPGPDTIH